MTQPFKASEPQRYAARMAACAVQPKAIAARLGITLATLNAWFRIPGFMALRDEFSGKVEEALEDDLIGATGEMLDLWRRWLRGEVEANDPRIAVISPTLLRWTEGTFGIASPGTLQKGPSGPSIQILNAPGTRAPNIRGFTDAAEDTDLDELRNLPPPRQDRVRRQIAAGGDSV